MPERFQPLAVVGVSALFPGSSTAHGFWRDILAGRDLITDVPARRWLIEDHYDPDPQAPDKTYCKRGAFLGDVEFDPVEFGVPPAALPATDTCQLLALIVAKQVLDDALSGQFSEVDRERASVILGVTSGQELFLEVASRLQAPVWVKALRECGIPEDKVQEVRQRISASYVPWQENTFPGLLGNVVAGRIANRFNLGGANCVTDAACASSLSALTMAASELQLGRSDLVITGGADTFNDISMFVCFSKTPALSPTGDCRPFSDGADGTILGEGLAMVALKRLDDAERDGNRIYAVIRGIGASSDGRSKSIYAPLPDGQAKAMRRAYAAAGYGPETVELVEAHGTGTAAGDAAEINSLTSVFHSPEDGRSQWCALGSVKSQVGHTKAAAGAAGLFKVVMALHHKVLPPTIKVERPNPNLHLERSPFYVNTQARPWIRPVAHPRRASVSAFGFGGTNFHVTLEEYNGERRPPLRWTAPAEVVLVAGASSEELAERCRGLAREARTRTPAELAVGSQIAFDALLPHRVAVVAESGEDLQKKLREFAEAGVAAPGVYLGSGAPTGRTAFLFPGQGSHYLGMTGELAMAFEEARAAWDEAREVAKLVFPPPAFSNAEREAQMRRLTATEWAQPAIGVASAALLGILRRLGLNADCAAGHSFGEITALYASGAIDFAALVAIARRRGELMAKAPAETGGMLSLRLDALSARGLIEQWRLELSVANENGPRQTVLSGKRSEIEEAARRCAAAGIEATALPVSTAFHSPLVAEAVSPFRDFVSQCPIGRFGLPVYSNLDGSVLPSDGGSVGERLARQIAEPVRFESMVEQMYADGVRTFLEVGPGAVLTSLVSGVLRDRPHQAIPLDRGSAHGVVSLWHALGRLAALGYPLDWGGLRQPHQVEAAPAPSGDRFVIPIHGGNHGRPYPPPGGAASLPPPVVTPPAQQTPVARTSQELVQSYRIFQESLSEAHRNWQANLAKGHDSFLRAMESAYLGTLAPAGLPGAAVPAPNPAHETVVAPLPEPALRVEAPAPAVPAASSPVAGADARELVWSVVADATGYPAEMLEPRMSLEADLGIDSIKRVEIFSTLQQSLPGLPEMDQSRMAELRTLAEIVEFLRQGAVSAAPVPAPMVEPPDHSAVVLAQIADKTGYPVEMLQPDMSLEADLGIDSIKRVEIFSALQEAVPGLPPFDTAALGSLRTIADVIAFLGKPASEPSRQPISPAARRVVKDISAPPSGHRTVDAADGAVAIVGAGEVAPLLARYLEARGCEARLVDVVPADAGVVIFLGLKTDAAVHFEALRAAQAVAPRFAVSGGVFVLVRDAGAAWTGGLAGLAKTAAVEWPGARVKCIGIEADGRTPEEIATALGNELLAGGPEAEVFLRAGGRTTPVNVPTEGSEDFRLAPDGVIVVSGGARGITAECVLALARRTAGRYLLLGRTQEDSAEVRRTLRSFEEAGAQARYARLDVRDGASLAAVLDSVRRQWGPVTGVIHGAGVLADRRIENLTREQFDSVWSTKVDGLRALLDATREDPLSLLCVFSSVAARCGNVGQAAYAMANEAMNCAVRSEAAQRSGRTKGKVIDWGPWDGGMVTPALGRRFEAQGVSLLGLEQGAAAFTDEILRAPAGDIEVVLGSAPPAPARQLRVRIDHRSHPFLADHRIQDVPVLPTVEALELFLRCAMAQESAAARFVCSDLKVLRGVRLNGFYGEGDVLFVRPRGEGVFELCGPGGVRHYEATLLPDGSAVSSNAPLDPGPLREAPWSTGEIYGKLLFHGPAFQVIQEVDGVSGNGILGTLTGTVERQWRDGHRRSDAAMLDGGLQLARLWGFHSLGKLTLPARIGRIHAEAMGGEPEPIRCRVIGKTVGSNKILCDVEFSTPSGAIIATMSEVEMYAAPGE